MFLCSLLIGSDSSETRKSLDRSLRKCAQNCNNATSSTFYSRIDILFFLAWNITMYKVDMYNEIPLKGHRIKKWLKILNRDDALVAFTVSSNKISFT